MKRTRTVGLLATGIFVMGAIGLVGWNYYARRPGPRVRELFTERGIEIVSHSDRVESYRLGGFRSRLTTTNPSVQQMEGFAITSRGSDLDAAAARYYANGLLDEKTYAIDWATNCIFDPHQGWRFVQGNESVDVLICVHCDDIQVTVRDAEGHEVHSSSRCFDESYAGF